MEEESSMIDNLYRKTFYFILLVILCNSYSCNNSRIKESNITEKKEKNVTPGHSFKSENDLKKSILINGDTTAYRELMNIYIENDQAPEFVVWALTMANKYHYKDACYDVYFCLQMTNFYYDSEDTTSSLDLLDKATRKIALEYLIKASNDRNKQAMKTLGKYYMRGKYFPKNIYLGNKLINDSER